MTNRVFREPFVLGTVLLLAFFLRFVGCWYGLPFLYHADEPIVVNHAMAYGSGDFNPHFFRIPPLVSYFVFFTYGVIFIGGRVLGFFTGLQDFEHLFYEDPTVFYFIARLFFGVLMGTASVYFLYRLVSKNLFREAALPAAFFFGVCYLHVRDSHFLYADIPLVLVMILGLRCFFDQHRTKKNLREWHLRSGCLIGLAAAVKYNGLSLAVPYVIYTLLVCNKRTLVLYWILAAFSSILVWALLNPFSLLDFRFFLEELHNEAQVHGGTPWLHHLQYSLRHGMGLPLLITALGGLISAFFARDPRQTALSVFLISYYCILKAWGQPYARYALPLLPILAFFAANFLVAINRSRRFQAKRGIVSVLAILIAMPTLLSSLRLDFLMIRKDTRTLARKWVIEHIPKNSKLALDNDFFMPRLSFSLEQLEMKHEALKGEEPFSGSRLRKLDYLISRAHSRPDTYRLNFLIPLEGARTERPLFAKPVLPYSLPRLKEEGVSYALIARVNPDANWSAFYEELANQAERVVLFNPYRSLARPWAMDPYALTAAPLTLKDLFSRERLGPPIEIYHL